MKNSFVVLVLAMASLQACSQKLTEAKVPQVVKDGFKKTFPNVTPTWEWEDANYEASFKVGDKPMSCIIDKQGTILETESAISVSELPASAKTYVDQHYKGKKWKEIAKIVKSNGVVNYEVNVNGTDVLFGANGNHLAKPKEEDEKD